MCDGVYVGESHTPKARIRECLNLITTIVSLNISVPTQTVTLIEEDLKTNVDPELKSTIATKLHHCEIVDRENFNCQGLVRSKESFLNTVAFDGRRLSSSFVAASIARLTDGWVSSSTIEFNESIWSTVLYTVIGWVVAIAVMIKLEA